MGRTNQPNRNQSNRNQPNRNQEHSNLGNRKKSIRSIFVRIFLFAFFCAVGIGSWMKYQEYTVVQVERAAVQKQIDEETDRQLHLEATTEYYQSDAYIAEVAREQLGLLKPGETVFINRSN